MPPTADEPWRALHVISYTNNGRLESLAKQLPQLAKMGINCLILEVNYGFEFESHPEARRDRQVTKAGARRLLETCRANGIELVPQFKCLGHQSWADNTGPLLVTPTRGAGSHPAFPEQRASTAASGIP